MIHNDSIGDSPDSRETLQPLPLVRRRNDLIEGIIVVRCDDSVLCSAACYWHFSSLLLAMKRLSLEQSSQGRMALVKAGRRHLSLWRKKAGRLAADWQRIIQLDGYLPIYLDSYYRCGWSHRRHGL